MLEKLLEKYPDKPWNWRWISKNPNLTMEFIEKNPDKPWDWENLSRNFTIEFIKKKSRPIMELEKYIR
jgi:DNA-dependent RNA polymerase auxiliary subunit epsilon